MRRSVIGILSLAALIGVLLFWPHGIFAQSHSISLSWTAGTGGGAVATYNVKRSTTSGTEVTIASVPSTQTTYSDTTGVAGTKYFYVITAVNSFGESGPSNEASATFIGNPPQAPAALQAVPN